MAEQTTSTSQTSSSQSTTPQKGKATILASVEDGVLQPDSMRGSEEHLKDVEVEDLEQDRRDAHEKLQKKA